MPDPLYELYGLDKLLIQVFWKVMIFVYMAVVWLRPVFFKLFSSRPILHSQIFSRPLKKGLPLKSISDSVIFPPTSRCSLKKKRSSPRIDLSFRYFCPKIKVFSKPAVPKLCVAKVCKSCCTYCFSHNNCNVKVISSKFS